MKDFLLIIDGSSLLTTQYYGNIPRDIMFAKTQEEKEKYYYKIMQTSTGIYTNAIYGFMRTLIKIINTQKPAYLAITWDISRDTFRREIYKEYKGNRGETPVPLKQQFILCQKMLSQMGIKQFMDTRYEADDFSGTLADKFQNEVPVRILTKDNDYLQLVTDRTNLWLMYVNAEKTDEMFSKYGINIIKDELPEKTFNFTPELVKKEFGVLPESINSLKGLQGDSSDNIKGVPGVGEKAARALIGEYGNIEALYNAINNKTDSEISEINNYWKEKLNIKRSPMVYLLKKDENELVGEKAAIISKKLATIKKDIDLDDISLEDLKLKLNIEEGNKAFSELEFKSLVLENKKEAETVSENIKETSDICDFEKFFSNINTNKMRYGMSIEKDDKGKLKAVFLSDSKETFKFISEGFLGSEMIIQKVNDLIKKGVKISVLNLKEILKVFTADESSGFFDAGVAAYLVNPLINKYDNESILKEYFDEKCYIESRTAFLAEPVLCEQLSRLEMTDLYFKLELPLIYTLSCMEKRGILVKKDELREYSQKLTTAIEQCEKKIYSEIGEKFNINSPKQLGVILFEKLNLPHGKKTKSGYSTSVDVLEKLQDKYPVIKLILEYRQLTKLKSTYAEGLSECIRDDGRIHCTFTQTVTATGRLSCIEPNLQNIPIRVALGKEIRKVFVPEEGYVFVDGDYSQIELRILAHMSEDERLIESYNSEMDIHRITASEVFHVPLDQVTDEQRSNAKAVNFGIVYGISSFGLGQGLNISGKEAQKYIDKYFETYPGIKKYLDESVAFAYQNGFSKTLYGRRRPIPELSSNAYMQKAFGERVAMNTPIQGTAADIIKIAMLNTEKRIKAEGLRSRLLLQIHDELLVEAYKDEVEIVTKIMNEEMSNAAKLSVKLIVEIKTGDNWFDAK